jgi:hypothetical protein
VSGKQRLDLVAQLGIVLAGVRQKLGLLALRSLHGGIEDGEHLF